MRPRSNPLAAHLPPEAEALLQLVCNRRDRFHLAGLLGHASSRSRPLDALDETDLAAYEAALVAAGKPRPKQAARDAAHAWNRMVGRAGWPSKRIEPKNNVPHSVLRFEQLPKPLQDDIEAFLARQSGEDIFGDDGGLILAPATLKDRRGKICQLISITIGAGIELKALRSLKDLVREPTARAILQALWDRSAHKPNGHTANLARLLRLIAKHHAGASIAVVALIGKAEAKLRPGKIGMTERNRRKLRRIVDDPQALARLVNLPHKILTKLDPTRPTLADALALQSCLAIQIELMAPMRAKNLAELDLDRHFDVVGPETCHIRIEALEVKNNQTLEYILGLSFMRLLVPYRDVYRPLLLGKATTTALFISRNGRQKTPDALSAQISKYIADETGLDVNPHLFRHLAGYLFLKAHPGEYEPVRQLLGHRSLRTTIEFYVGLEQAHSFRRYDEIVQSFSDRGPSHAAAE